jgi:hypothetical protein
MSVKKRVEKRGDWETAFGKCIKECYDLTKALARLTSVGTTVMDTFYGRTWAKLTYNDFASFLSEMSWQYLSFFSGFGFIWLRAIGGGNHDIAEPIAY